MECISSARSHEAEIATYIPIFQGTLFIKLVLMEHMYHYYSNLRSRSQKPYVTKVQKYNHNEFIRATIIRYCTFFSLKFVFIGVTDVHIMRASFNVSVMVNFPVFPVDNSDIDRRP